MPSHSEGPGIWLSVWRFLLTHCLYERAVAISTKFAWRGPFYNRPDKSDMITKNFRGHVIFTFRNNSTMRWCKLAHIGCPGLAVRCIRDMLLWSQTLYPDLCWRFDHPQITLDTKGAICLFSSTFSSIAIKQTSHQISRVTSKYFTRSADCRCDR